MNFNNIKFIARWVIVYILTGVMLLECSTQDHPAAPISSVYNNNRNIKTDPTISIVSNNTPIPHSPKNITVNNQTININKPINELVISTPKINSVRKRFYNRNYYSIPKGTYTSNSYTVKRGDTLFYIAWITGNDYHDLAERNKITKPFNLNIGQVINIANSYNNSGIRITNTNRMLTTNNKDVHYQQTNTYVSSINEQNSKKRSSKVTLTKPLINTTSPAKTTSLDNNINIVGKWRWPTKGQVIEAFSNMQGGNKGIDITGLRGQPIFATAAGKVVYCGNALRGYGNLIIIKHNNDYLSAYAHNDTILVHDQQEIHAGQKIATMGSTGTSSVRLHFEIRHKGKSVNPLRYLTQQ